MCRWICDRALRTRRSLAYLNELNPAIVDELQGGGEVFVSNAVLDGRYVCGACIVNFRTLRVG